MVCRKSSSVIHIVEPLDSTVDGSTVQYAYGIGLGPWDSYVIFMFMFYVHAFLLTRLYQLVLTSVLKYYKYAKIGFMLVS